ncbi:MAG TPA: hypothetical protein VG737_11920, partial [Cyclobacteriaceae bacterium]|nr:hypothetical protein [Cyclobacteriaceae bacterium]
ESLLASRNFELTDNMRKTFRLAGQELATLAIDHPGAHLKGLSLLKIVSEKNISPDELPIALDGIRSSLWHALPEGDIAPASQSSQPHRIDEAFIRQLEATTHE